MIIVRRWMKLFLPGLVILLVLAACSSETGSKDDGNRAAYHASSGQTAGGLEPLSGSDAATAPREQYLIYTGTMTIKTSRFEETIAAIFDSLTTAGGYMVSQEDKSDANSRSSTIEVRVPAEHFFTWIEGVEQLPNIKLSKSIKAEDVSEEYVDLVARLEAKQLVIEKYKEYMQMATTADDLIRYTNELAELQEELEAVQARIRYLQNRVAYSTITIKVTEEVSRSFFRELQVGSQFVEAFELGISGFFSVLTFLIVVIISICPLILLAAILIPLWRRFGRRREHTGGWFAYPSRNMNAGQADQRDMPDKQNVDQPADSKDEGETEHPKQT